MSPVPSSLEIDPLCCQEDSWDVDDVPLATHTDMGMDIRLHPSDEPLWAEALSSMLSREGEAALGFSAATAIAGAERDHYLVHGRGEAVGWVARAGAWHGLSAPALILAVTCLDRCFLSPGATLHLQEDKPWMARLAALACLSLATKVEDTHPPPLLHLQATPDAPNYVFEAKTIKRMELLVLSALGWRLNPVTPLSFIHHLIPKLLASDDATTARQWLHTSESILLNVIPDWRWLCYPSSVWAAATLLHAVRREPSHHQSLLTLLNTPEHQVEECYQLIHETMPIDANGCYYNLNGCGNSESKRKHSTLSCYYYNAPESPSGVIGSCFSSDNSTTSAYSWPASASVSSSPHYQPPAKKPNTNDRDDLHLLHLLL